MPTTATAACSNKRHSGVLLFLLLLGLQLPLLISLGENLLDHRGRVKARCSARVALLEQPETVHAGRLLLLLLRGRAALGAGLHCLRVEEVGEVVALEFRARTRT